MSNKSIKELEDEADKFFKSAKRWEGVAKNTERAEKVLDVAGLFTGGGALVGGAKMLGKKLLKKKIKKGVKDPGVTVQLKQPYGSKQIRTAPLATPYSTQTSAKELKKSLKNNIKELKRNTGLPDKTTLGSLGVKAATGLGLEMIGSEVGRKTGVDLPDLGYSQQLFFPRKAQAPGNNPPKSVLKKEILRRKYKSSKP